MQQSAAWTATFFHDVDVVQANALSNKPKMYIAETGWPTVSYVHSWFPLFTNLEFQASSDLGNANNGASAASEANLQVMHPIGGP